MTQTKSSPRSPHLEKSLCSFPTQPESTETMLKQSFKVENSLAVWRLGLCGLTAEGEGSIPGRELRYRRLWGCDP